ncbi:Solute Carrier Family 12 Member 1 [Manis pentadactyla]|nr:Solute Carrier Family 12 Member 1 [Manis pentadactyla]
MQETQVRCENDINQYEDEDQQSITAMLFGNNETGGTDKEEPHEGTGNVSGLFFINRPSFLSTFFWFDQRKYCDGGGQGETKDEYFTSKTWNTGENKRELLQEPNGDIDMCVWKSKLSKV